MVKKIDSSTPRIPTGSSSVDSTKSVESVKVGTVSGVRETGNVNKFRSPTREITPDLKKQLFQMIEEEAEKILSGDGISEKRKARVKNALKMAVETGNIEIGNREKEEKE